MAIVATHFAFCFDELFVATRTTDSEKRLYCNTTLHIYIDEFITIWVVISRLPSIYWWRSGDLCVFFLSTLCAAVSGGGGRGESSVAYQW